MTMTTKLHCAKCGAKRNSRGRLFTSQQALDNHMAGCNGVRKARYSPDSEDYEESLESMFPLTSEVVSDDESDGVFFAIADYLGEL